MENSWSNKWKKCLIWFSGYMSFIAFALVGGYVIAKGEDEELKKTAKNALIVALIFAAARGFLTVFSGFAGMSENYYSSAAYDFYSISSSLVNIAAVLIYAVIIILELTKKDTPQA